MTAEPSAQINLHTQNADDLFIKPAILLDDLRPMNKDAEELIFEKARTLPRGSGISIIIQTKNDLTMKEADAAAMIQRHFLHCRKQAEKQLRHTLNLGWRSLAIAFVFLIIMYSVANRLFPRLPEGGLMISVKELFIILGWVALWRPAELLLYEWFPIRKKARLFARLAESDIKFVTKNMA
jgi:hypothetical protein